MGPARGWRWGWGVVWEVWGWGWTQHSEGGKRRWQVEVRAEQFSTVGVEVRRGKGWGSRVGPECEQGLRLSRKQ